MELGAGSDLPYPRLILEWSLRTKVGAPPS